MISFKTRKFISQYDNNISFENFNKTVDYLTTRSDLSNVEVKIYYLRRQNLINIQGKRHIEFWQKYFLAWVLS